jgi:hypothetical protein
MTSVVVTSDRSRRCRTQGDGKGLSQPGAADSSRPPKEFLLSGARRASLASRGSVLADRSVPSQLLMGNGNGPVAWVFTRQSAAQLRTYSVRADQQRARRGLRRWQNQGHSSGVSVDLHGVKTPGGTTLSLDQNLRRRIFCGKLLAIARCRSKDSSG